MALKDLLTLVDDKLKDAFHKVTYDPTKDRTKLVKRIDDTKTKFEAGSTKGRKDFSVSNHVVEYRPTLDGQPLALDGREALYVPAERFPEFLDHFKKTVEEGHLDKQLEERPVTANISSAVRRQYTERAPRGERLAGSSGGREWSPERRAKFAETIAARNAAKQR